MTRNILSNLHHSCPKQQSGFPLHFYLTENEDTYNRLFREVGNVVIRQGNEPTDILIDFETATVKVRTNQMPQLRVLKNNFNLIYSSSAFIST